MMHGHGHINGPMSRRELEQVLLGLFVDAAWPEADTKARILHHIAKRMLTHVQEGVPRYAMLGPAIGASLSPEVRALWHEHRLAHGGGLLGLLKGEPHFRDAQGGDGVQLDVVSLEEFVKARCERDARDVWTPRIKYMVNDPSIDAWLSMEVALHLIRISDCDSLSSLEPDCVPFECSVARAELVVGRQWQLQPPEDGQGAAVPSASRLLDALRAEPLFMLRSADGREVNPAFVRQVASGYVPPTHVFVRLLIQQLPDVARMAREAAATASLAAAPLMSQAAAMLAALQATSQQPPAFAAAPSAGPSSGRPAVGGTGSTVNGAGGTSGTTSKKARQAARREEDRAEAGGGGGGASFSRDEGSYVCSGTDLEAEELLAAADLVWPPDKDPQSFALNTVARAVIQHTRGGRPYSMNGPNVGNTIKTAWRTQTLFAKDQEPLPFRIYFSTDPLFFYGADPSGHKWTLKAPGPLLQAANDLSMKTGGGGGGGGGGAVSRSARAVAAAPAASMPGDAADAAGSDTAGVSSGIGGSSGWRLNSLGYRLIETKGVECRGWSSTARCSHGGRCWNHHPELGDEAAEALGVPTLRRLVPAISSTWPEPRPGDAPDALTFACRVAALHLAKRLPANGFEAGLVPVEGEVIKSWRHTYGPAVKFPGRVADTLSRCTFFSLGTVGKGKASIRLHAEELLASVAASDAAAQRAGQRTGQQAGQQAGPQQQNVATGSHTATQSGKPAATRPSGAASGGSGGGAGGTAVAVGGTGKASNDDERDVHLQELRQAACQVWPSNDDDILSLVRRNVALFIVDFTFSVHNHPGPQDFHARLLDAAKEVAALWGSIHPEAPKGVSGEALPPSVEDLKQTLAPDDKSHTPAPYFWVYLVNETDVWGVQLNAVHMMEHAKHLRLGLRLSQDLACALQPLNDDQLLASFAKLDRLAPPGRTDAPQQQQQQQQVGQDELTWQQQQQAGQDKLTWQQQQQVGQGELTWQQREQQRIDDLDRFSWEQQQQQQGKQQGSQHYTARAETHEQSSRDAAAAAAAAGATWLSVTASIRRVWSGSVPGTRLKREVALKLASVVKGTHGRMTLPLSTLETFVKDEHDALMNDFYMMSLQQDGGMGRLRTLLNSDECFALAPLATSDRSYECLVTLKAERVRDVAAALPPSQSDDAEDSVQPPPPAAPLDDNHAAAVAAAAAAVAAAAIGRSRSVSISSGGGGAAAADSGLLSSSSSRARDAAAAGGSNNDRRDTAAAAERPAGGVRAQLFPGTPQYDAAAAASLRRHPSRPGAAPCKFYFDYFCQRGERCMYDHPFEKLPPKRAAQLALRLGCLPAAAEVAADGTGGTAAAATSPLVGPGGSARVEAAPSGSAVNADDMRLSQVAIAAQHWYPPSGKQLCGYFCRTGACKRRAACWFRHDVASIETQEARLRLVDDLKKEGLLVRGPAGWTAVSLVAPPTTPPAGSTYLPRPAPALSPRAKEAASATVPPKFAVPHAVPRVPPAAVPAAVAAGPLSAWALLDAPCHADHDAQVPSTTTPSPEAPVNVELELTVDEQYKPTYRPYTPGPPSWMQQQQQQQDGGDIAVALPAPGVTSSSSYVSDAALNNLGGGSSAPCPADSTPSLYSGGTPDAAATGRAQALLASLQRGTLHAPQPSGSKAGHGDGMAANGSTAVHGEGAAVMGGDVAAEHDQDAVASMASEGAGEAPPLLTVDGSASEAPAPATPAPVTAHLDVAAAVSSEQAGDDGLPRPAAAVTTPAVDEGTPLLLTANGDALEEPPAATTAAGAFEASDAVPKLRVDDADEALYFLTADGEKVYFVEQSGSATLCPGDSAASPSAAAAAAVPSAPAVAGASSAAAEGVLDGTHPSQGVPYEASDSAASAGATLATAAAVVGATAIEAAAAGAATAGDAAAMADAAANADDVAPNAVSPAEDVNCSSVFERAAQRETAAELAAEAAADGDADDADGCTARTAAGATADSAAQGSAVGRAGGGVVLADAAAAVEGVSATAEQSGGTGRLADSAPASPSGHSTGSRASFAPLDLPANSGKDVPPAQAAGGGPEGSASSACDFSTSSSDAAEVSHPLASSKPPMETANGPGASATLASLDAASPEAVPSASATSTIAAAVSPTAAASPLTVATPSPTAARTQPTAAPPHSIATALHSAAATATPPIVATAPSIAATAASASMPVAAAEAAVEAAPRGPPGVGPPVCEDLDLGPLVKLMPDSLAQALQPYTTTTAASAADTTATPTTSTASNAYLGLVAAQEPTLQAPLQLLYKVMLDDGRDVVLRFYGKGRTRKALPSVRPSAEEAVSTLRSALGNAAALTAPSGNSSVGVPGTLHRVSALHDASGRVQSVTYHVSRAVTGIASIVIDLLAQVAGLHASPAGGLAALPALLVLGGPSVGRSTLLRDVARLLSVVFSKSVLLLDTANDGAGQCLREHPSIGDARRLTVSSRDKQASLLAEALVHHEPDVVIVDDLASAEGILDARKRSTCVVASALAVDLADALATDGGKLVAPFTMVVEVLGLNSWRVHRNAAESVAAARTDAQPDCPGEVRRFDAWGRVVVKFEDAAAAGRAMAVAAAAR